MNNSSSDRLDGGEAHGVSLRVDHTPSPHATLLALGSVSLPDVREALRALEAARAADPSLSTLVIDALDVSRFGRGAVVEIARWIPRYGATLERVLLVSTSTQLRSSVQALAACAPHVQVRCVETRDAAGAWLGAPAPALTG